VAAAHHSQAPRHARDAERPPLKRGYTALREQPAPPPDPQARLRARRAALDEFARVQVNKQAQAAEAGISVLPAKARAWANRTRTFAMAAGIGVAVIGIAITWPMLNHDPDLLGPRIAPDVFDPPAATSAAAPVEEPAEVAGAPTEPAPVEAAAVEAAPVESRPESGRMAVAPAAEIPAPIRRPAPRAAQESQSSTPAELRAAESEKKVSDERLEDLEFEVRPPVKKSAPVSVISAEDIGRFPDANAAEALQRVPSVRIERTATPAVRDEGRGELSEVVVTGARRSRSTSPNKSAVPTARVRASSGSISQPIEAPYEESGRDRFEHFESGAVKRVSEAPVSTFSADVDTASYGFVRKQLNQGLLPQKDAVRVEEMINYFDYSWPAAESRDEPFRPTVVVSDSPWGTGRKLIHIGIKGYELPERKRPDANLVLLIDVSGSMNAPDKLPLVKDSMRLLVENLKPDDTVGIVVYAGAAGLVLPPTRISEKEKILEAIARLTPGGSTAGAEGIRLAYDLAERSFRKNGVNRILLATDGDFNVGIDSTRELKGYVERKRERGVFLSVLGYGQGNYRDELAQALAQNGNGVAAYIDTLNEAHKVLVREADSSLFTIAKDVKLQVEFNPATVAEYRLVGYETRALNREDFNNDAVDAGDVGAGHTVTAIYEITPVDADARAVDGLRYAPAEKAAGRKDTANEYGFLKIRYKLPDGFKSRLIEQPIPIDSGKVSEAIARDVAFSTAVAGFGQLLRGGEHTGPLSHDDVASQALASRGEDPFGYRNEFVQLVRKAQSAKGM
jgi:Ca-activated chloride channel family protein